MRLIIDIGNTAVKVALFNKNRLIRTAQFKTCSLQEIKTFVKKQSISAAFISSVRKMDKKTLKLIQFFNAVIFDANTLLPIEINYKTPNTLGRDRIAGIVASSYLYPKQDVLVIDAGTCLTIDFINSEKQYLGGRISPGLAMRYKALHQFTNQLPLCDIKSSEDFIGNDTNSSIISGVQKGITSEVDAVINTFRKENKDAIVVVTGGDSFFFEKGLKNSIFANPFLVMEGLNEILDYNE